MGGMTANQIQPQSSGAEECYRLQRALSGIYVIFKITFWRAPMANRTRKNRNSRILDRAAIYGPN
jgi:hypothetical protein